MEAVVTVVELAGIICVASGIFAGRPAWDEGRCLARAEIIHGAAARHGVDPVVMVAIDVLECELRDDAHRPYHRVVRGRRVLAGHDACPMGVRIPGRRGVEEHDLASLYDLGASRLAWWTSWCRRGHPGRHRPSHDPAGRPHHDPVAHYNWGNPAYAPQVLAVAAALRGRQVRVTRGLADRVVVFLSRIYRSLGVAWRLEGRSS